MYCTSKHLKRLVQNLFSYFLNVQTSNLVCKLNIIMHNTIVIIMTSFKSKLLNMTQLHIRITVLDFNSLTVLVVLGVNANI